jgi:hypothetical protein
MSCCSPSGYGKMFGAKTAEKEARRYRRKGLTASAQWLRETLASEGLDGRTVLEVGGGVGGLQIELLEAGAASAVNVELVDSYEVPAQSLLAEHGLGGRVERRVGDFAQDEGGAPGADIVVMHRVLCCYPDADLLMTIACRRAEQRVAITIPRHTWWIRAGMWMANAWLRLRRIAFQAYVHQPEPILGVATSRGFQIEQRMHGWIWESLILRRHEPSADGGIRTVHEQRSLGAKR